jgi:hypothetical protein
MWMQGTKESFLGAIGYTALVWSILGLSTAWTNSGYPSRQKFGSLRQQRGSWRGVDQYSLTQNLYV